MNGGVDTAAVVGLNTEGHGWEDGVLLEEDHPTKEKRDREEKEERSSDGHPGVEGKGARLSVAIWTLCVGGCQEGKPATSR